jgi:hypothetical protein
VKNRIACELAAPYREAGRVQRRGSNGPKSSFFLDTVDRRLEIIRPFMPIGIRSKRIPQARGEERRPMEERPIRPLVNSFSRTIRLARGVTRAEMIAGALAWKTRLSRDKRRKANFGGRRCFILCRVPLSRGRGFIIQRLLGVSIIPILMFNRQFVTPRRGVFF